MFLQSPADNTPFSGHTKIAIFLLTCIVALTLFLHLGALTSDIQHGISDWHPDSARYLVQGRQYIRGNYRPIGSTPWYTGNPYANILMLSLLWRGLDRVTIWMGYEPLPLTNRNLSLVSRFFCLLLCVLLIFIIYFFSARVFRSTRIGLLAALLWGLSPLSICLNHIIKPEIPLTFFVTLAAIIAYYTSEENRFSLYILEGITAGIAAAVKYNGAIVLLYFFAMHAYRIFKKESPAGKVNTIRKLFSLRLFIAAILSILTFYAFEPILWLGLSKGILYIRQYLHTAAYAATPRALKLHNGIFMFLLYSFKTFPHNLWVFARAAHPVILILSIIALVFPTPSFKLQKYRIVFFPFLILFVLFLTKPLIGAEFLLHFLPFVYITAALGLYSLYNQISAYKFKGAKVIAFLPFILTVVICLYASFYEITYFSIGNIRYHAQEWAAKNLKGQCVRLEHHTLRHRPPFCAQKSPAAIARYSKTSFKPHPKTVILKSFNLERSKPLIHLIRGYKLRFEGFRAFFDDLPRTPVFPAPFQLETRDSFLRFLNGVDLDPRYNSFFLHANTTYTWTVVSRYPQKTFTCHIINGDCRTTLSSDNLPAPITLLPCEHRDIRVPVYKQFPWHSPYLYSFSFRSSHHLFLHLSLEKNQIKQVVSPSSGNLLPSEITPEKAISFLSHLDDKSENAFNKTFRAIFHYDFSLLKDFLSLQIPPDNFTRSNLSRLFFKAKGPNDYYLWTKYPIFLKKGNYFLEGTGDFFLPPHGKVTFTATTLGGILGKITFSSNGKTTCSHNHVFQCPFHVSSGVPVYFFMVFRGNAAAAVKNLVIRFPFQSAFKTALQKKVIFRFIQDAKSRTSLTRIVSSCAPTPFSALACMKVGAAFLGMKQDTLALPWLKSAVSKDSLNREAYTLLAKAYRHLSDLRDAQKIKQNLTDLAKVKTGVWQFETGLTLRGFTLQNRFKRGQKISSTLYFSLPDFNGGQTAFISFINKGKYYFGKDFNLFETKPEGELRRIDGAIQIPPNIPSGTYDVYFTFRIFKTDYWYRRVKDGEIIKERRILIRHIKID